MKFFRTLYSRLLKTMKVTGAFRARLSRGLRRIHRGPVAYQTDNWLPTQSEGATDGGRHTPAQAAAAYVGILPRRVTVQEATHMGGCRERLVHDGDVGPNRPHNLLGRNHRRRDGRVHLRRLCWASFASSRNAQYAAELGAVAALSIGTNTCSDALISPTTERGVAKVLPRSRTSADI